MISNTPFNTILIRLSILWFRSITPICTVLSLGSLVGLLIPSRFFPHSSTSSPLPVTKSVLIPICILTASEPLFYLLVYLPRLRYLQKNTVPAEGTALTRLERQTLATKFLAEVDDVKFWFRMWFRFGDNDHENDSIQVRKSAVRQWIAWGVFNRYSLDGMSDEDSAELDGYLRQLEGKSNGEVTLLDDQDSPERESGKIYNVGTPIRVTIDPMRVLHRPLLFYIFGAGLIDSVLFWKMWKLGFRYFPVRRSCASFPLRPMSVLTRQNSPSQNISYWYRPHTSRRRLPILYIHGIGVGLITYTDFFAELISKDTGDPDDQVGILAVEIMPISFRLTSPISTSEILARQIQQILDHHGWNRNKFVLAANSYGTIIATHLLRLASIAPCIGPIILIDPVTLWAHMGDVAYNFTVRNPRTASEWQLWYFACTDLMAAHTVTRRFVWRDNVLWRDEIQGRKIGIVLSGADIILDAHRLRKFVAGDRHGVQIGDTKANELIRVRQEVGEPDWEVLWLEYLNHAEVFEKKSERAVSVDLVWRYCLKQADARLEDCIEA